MSASLSPRILLLFLHFLFFFAADGLRSILSDIPKCPAIDCGNNVSIPYPFWVSDPTIQSTSFCGYPDFKITCNGAKPSFRTYTDNYTVKAIDTTSHTLSLIDSVVIGLDCPRARHNVSLGTIPLNFSDSIGHLIFFFNCDSNKVPPAIPEEYHATCLQNASGLSYVFNGETPPELYVGLYGACKGGTVVSPVLKGTLTSGNLAMSFGKAMNGGFELIWKDSEMEDCKNCEESRGLCGYNNDTGSGLNFQCFCKDGIHYGGDCNTPIDGKGKNGVLKIGIGVGAVIIIIVFIFGIFCLSKPWTWGKLHASSVDKNVETFLMSHGPLAVKRYSYSEVKQMTASFSTQLGQGGYGTVYKGQLRDGTPVAVKVLRDTKGSGEEFINEVASIGRTNHMNVVSLLGFCSEGSKGALIYEFMPNGSLEKFLFVDDPRSTTPLGWEQLHNIAVGIARGLEYLHRGCTTRIVHFDIKPHNILLDEDLCPKISDFGLAKLCKPKESILSMVCARGTIGYIAPEVFSRNFGLVSSKSDVYSYGMMILEMVGGRRNVKACVDNSSEIYFPHWIYEHLDDNYGLQACANSVETKVARKMALIGLWCIQTNPTVRPSISRVVEILEGSDQDLDIPPKPYICSPERSRCNSNVDSCPTLSMTSS